MERKDIEKAVVSAGYHLTEPVEAVFGKDGWVAVKIQEPPGFALLHFQVGPLSFFSVRTCKIDD